MHASPTPCSPQTLRLSVDDCELIKSCNDESGIYLQRSPFFPFAFFRKTLFVLFLSSCYPFHVSSLVSLLNLGIVRQWDSPSLSSSLNRRLLKDLSLTVGLHLQLPVSLSKDRAVIKTQVDDMCFGSHPAMLQKETDTEKDRSPLARVKGLIL